VDTDDTLWWRPVVAGPVVALATLVAALFATQDANVPLRDPDNVAALYLALVGAGVVLLAAIDIAIRGGRHPSRAALTRIRRERWTPARMLAVGTAIVSFYVSYMAYRNLKAVVPLLRPGTLFDRPLADLDRELFAGHDPAALLHSVLGTGISTHALSTAYVAFIVFLPLSLGIAVVFASQLNSGLFYATALSLNWILGAASYLALPSLGPIYFEPGAFAHLPHTEVTNLQAMLLEQRVDFLRDPVSSTPQAIAAFASLHVSMSLTAALTAQLMGLGRRLRQGLWIWVAITTVGTVHLGWHYMLDDAAGVLIAVLALGLARLLTGVSPRAHPS
jgi:hypothetical protein